MQITPINSKLYKNFTGQNPLQNSKMQTNAVSMIAKPVLNPEVPAKKTISKKKIAFVVGLAAVCCAAGFGILSLLKKGKASSVIPPVGEKPTDGLGNSVFEISERIKSEVENFDSRIKDKTDEITDKAIKKIDEIDKYFQEKTKEIISLFEQGEQKTKDNKPIRTIITNQDGTKTMKEFAQDGTTLTRESKFKDNSPIEFSEYFKDKKECSYVKIHNYATDDGAGVFLPEYFRIEKQIPGQNNLYETKEMQYVLECSKLKYKDAVLESYSPDQRFSNGAIRRKVSFNEETFTDSADGIVKTKKELGFDSCSKPMHCDQTTQYPDGSSYRIKYHTNDFKNNYAPVSFLEESTASDGKINQKTSHFYHTSEMMDGQAVTEEKLRKINNDITEKYFLAQDGNWVKE